MWTVVVACTEAGGIGVRGALPWRLPGDMAFFKRITTETTDPTKVNAVVMGRKTWDSLPPKFRPLAQRINVVVTSAVSSPQQSLELRDTWHVPSLNAAKTLLETSELAARVESAHIIGGGRVYEDALTTRLPDRVYLTRVRGFTGECDVSLPPDTPLGFGYKQVHTHSYPDADEHTENNLVYRFEVYERS